MREHDEGRLVTQRTLFAGPTSRAPDQLYCKVEAGVSERQRARLHLHEHARVSTNSYFGRFPASYWQRWTTVDEVRLDAVVSGSGLVRLVASDSEGEARTVAAHRVGEVDREPLRLPTRIDRFVDGGALWLEVETTTGAFVLDDVRWTVPASQPHRRTAVVICTFNRADDCIATLLTLAADGPARAAVDAVYVVDQGSDPIESRERFAEVRAALGGSLRYIRQPNLGGAGGFTRGIYEVADLWRDEHANVLLMDDDIMLEPDTVIRMTALANHTVEPTIVGGQMLNMLHPRRLRIGAERADLAALRAGVPVDRALSNADVTEEHQDPRADPEYTAWWSCLIPSEIVAAIGYPLPMFLQWDDIEYSLRARGAGFPIVTLPGAGVWHLDFEWKNWDDWSRYFTYRNSLIVSALHSDFDRRRIVARLARQLTHCLVTMRYGLAATLIRAVEDFLHGPDILHDGGSQVAAEIRKMRAEYPETVNRPAHGVPGITQAAMPLVSDSGPPPLLALVLARRAASHLRRKSRRIAAVAAKDAQWWHLSRFDTVVVTDSSEEGVRIHRRDPELMLALARQGAEVLWRLARNGKSACVEYRRRLPELTSRDNWTRLFTSR